MPAPEANTGAHNQQTGPPLCITACASHLLVSDARADVNGDLDDLLGELLGQVFDAGAALAAAVWGGGEACGVRMAVGAHMCALCVLCASVLRVHCGVCMCAVCVRMCCKRAAAQTCGNVYMWASYMSVEVSTDSRGPFASPHDEQEEPLPSYRDDPCFDTHWDSRRLNWDKKQGTHMYACHPTCNAAPRSPSGHNPCPPPLTCIRS